MRREERVDWGRLEYAGGGLAASGEDALMWGEDEDEPLFDEVVGREEARGCWDVLVVDDDAHVHDVTRLVLGELEFLGKPVRLVSAYSAAEAGEVMRANPDIALILLDVVMEDDAAGLNFVKTVREEFANPRVRIVLRTGQPGQAPEREVVLRYEIDGYELKTGLTAQGLVTVVVAALRSYSLITELEENRQGLEDVVLASAELARTRTIDDFASSVMHHLSRVAGGERARLFCVEEGDQQARVVAASEELGWTEGRLISELDDAEGLKGAFEEASGGISGTLGLDDRYARFASDEGKSGVVILEAEEPRGVARAQLVDVFCANMAVLMDNVHLNGQLKRAHRATVVALAALAEFRDTDTGEHVVRVASMVEAIAQELRAGGAFREELSPEVVSQIGLSSMLHDVGKVAIPDSVLLKPGKLDAEERALMETHAEEGARILEKAGAAAGRRSYMALAARIARTHHEWFDGGGYPQGLAGEAIPVAGRITAVADVFDALAHERPYKKAWPREEAVEYIRARAGGQFDPRVVEAFLRVVLG